MRNCLFLLYGLPLVVALPAHAQDEAVADVSADTIIIADELAETAITVLGNGTRSYVRNNGLAVTVFDRAGMEQIQGPDLAGMLEAVPGVTVSRNGGLGSLTALRLRGAEADQLLVVRDGVPVLDAAAPGGGFDLSAVLPGSLGKMELLRSSNSTIWGSSAIAGVLALETPRNWNGYSASLEYGGPRSLYATALAGFSSEVAGLALHGSALDSGGISAAAGGSEPDGVWQWQAGGEARLAPSDSLVLRAAGDFGRSLLDIDGFPAPDYLLGDTAETQEGRFASGHAGLEYFRNDLQLNGGYGFSDTRRDYFDPGLGSAPTYSTHGHIERVDLRGLYWLADHWSIAFGGERQWSRMETLFDPRIETASSGAYAQLGHSRGGVVINAGLRFDDHRDFGNEWSFGADGAVSIDDNWRLRASYGEGFKAPTLFQLRSEYGNSALQPERSRSFDLGLRYSGWNFEAQVNLFRRDSEDLIGFFSCFGESAGICTDRPFGTYDNIGRARAQGIEVEASLDVADDVWLGVAYSYLEAFDRTAGSPNEGNDLARRPRQALTASANWQEGDSGLSLQAEVRVVSASFDDAANLVPLDGYATGIIRASYPLTDEVELFGRIENIWDEQYQTAAGYGTPGRSAYAGARARW